MHPTEGGEEKMLAKRKTKNNFQTLKMKYEAYFANHKTNSISLTNLRTPKLIIPIKAMKIIREYLYFCSKWEMQAFEYFYILLFRHTLLEYDKMKESNAQQQQTFTFE